MSALVLTALRVARTPGIPDAFELGPLGPGVVVVHGPNGSGKSSTARAIEAALWPAAHRDARLAIRAEWTMDGATWRVERDGAWRQVQRDGADATLPALPAPELRDRYHLSLHDLMAGDRGGSFAAVIARQSAGGWDLGAAAQAIGARARPSPATSEREALRQASERLRGAQLAQAALQRDARELDALRARLAGARDAHAREVLYARAARHARLAREADAAALALAQATNALPGGASAPAAIPVARALVDALAAAEHQVNDEARRASESTARLDEARAQLGRAVTDEQLAALDAVAFGELAALARECARLDAEVAAADAEVARRATVRATAVDDPHERATVVSPAMVAGLATVAAIACVAAILLRLPALAWIGGAASAAIVVHVTIAALQRRAGAAALDRARALALAAARGVRAELAARESAMAARRADAAARLGVAPGGATELAWIADRVARWQEARLARRGHDEAMHTARAQRDQLLARLESVLAADGLLAPERDVASAAEARGLLQEAERRATAHAASLQRVRDAAAVTRGECDAARAELEATPGWTAALLAEDAAALEARRADCEAAMQELEPLGARVATLEAEVRRARGAHDVEDALAAVSAAGARLREQRDADVRDLLGDLLVRHLQERTRDQQRPEVFRRARALFARITRGRYTLQLAEGGAAGWGAYDEETRVGHALDELSSATRVQLLLAVRVAFVEAQEQGVRLPLLLDETLGTSDDVRADAIVDAIAALAADGRQVFYFTAQRDEVARWIAALSARGLPWTEVDLAARRALAACEAPAPMPAIAAMPRPAAPDPHGMTHADYGDALGVPPLQPATGDEARTPLWYLVDDVRALHDFQRHGVTTWGALHAWVRNAGLRVPGGHDAAYARAHALAKAVAALHAAAATGRGRPVDRHALEASGAVSPALMERVVAVAARLGGDARRLAAALDAREVAGFQERKRQQLRDWLEREGYLPPELPCAPPELHEAMLVAVAREVTDGVITIADVEALQTRIVSRLPGVAAPTDAPTSFGAPSMLGAAGT